MTAEKSPQDSPKAETLPDAGTVTEAGAGAPAFGTAGGAYGSAGGQGSQGGRSDEYPTAPGAGMEPPRGVAAEGEAGSPDPADMPSRETPSGDAETARPSGPAR